MHLISGGHQGTKQTIYTGQIRIDLYHHQTAVYDGQTVQIFIVQLYTTEHFPPRNMFLPKYYVIV